MRYARDPATEPPSVDVLFLDAETGEENGRVALPLP